MSLHKSDPLVRNVSIADSVANKRDVQQDTANTVIYVFISLNIELYRFPIFIEKRPALSSSYVIYPLRNNIQYYVCTEIVVSDNYQYT